MNSSRALWTLGGALAAVGQGTSAPAPWVWPGKPPEDCLFEPSDEIAGIAFTDRHSDYTGFADTWYPSWASDGRLYSPCIDGSCPGSTAAETAPFRGMAKTPLPGRP